MNIIIVVIVVSIRYKDLSVHIVIYERHKVVTIRYKDLIIHIIIHECRKGHSDNYNSYIRIYSRQSPRVVLVSPDTRH